MTRLQRERKTVETMISEYCRDNHHRNTLCADCASLKEYAFSRLADCRFGDKKPVCSRCATHCYKPHYRIRIKEVMRHAGPRMTYRHPVMAIRYLLDKRRTTG